jgi:PKD repeat protein
VANAGADQFTQTLTTITLNGSGSSDPDGTIALASWAFGDGTNAAGLTVTHDYASAGTYTATLTVIDNDGSVDTDTAIITVANRPPVANAGPNQSGTTGVALTFNGTGSSDPDGTITSYTWSFGDGTTGTGAVVSHAYATSGTYTVTLTVRDDDNAQTSDTAVATITAPSGGTWAKAIGGDIGDGSYALGVDGAGNVFVGGTFRTTITVGGSSFTSAGGADWYLIKYDPNGTALWARTFGGTGEDSMESLAVDPAGNVVVTGRISGTVNLGGTALVASGTSDIAVAKYAGSNGVHQWSKRFGGVYDDSGAAVAVDDAGDVYLTGYFRGTVDFGGGVLRVPFTTDLDVFVAKFTSAGAHAWSKNFTNDGNDRGYGIAVDGVGGVFVVGAFSNLINFGGSDLVSQNAMMDAFVVKLSTATGGHAWSRQMGAPDGNEAAYSAVVDAAGNLAVCGYAIKGVDFGGGTLGALGGSDGFVASYRGTTGAHLWSRRLGGTNNDYAYGVALAPDGGIVVAGAFDGTAAFGGGSLTSAGGGDAFAAKYSSTGSPSWARPLGGAAADVGQEVVVAPSGHPVVSGYFYDTATFGGATLTSAGMADAFVAKLAP